MYSMVTACLLLTVIFDTLQHTQLYGQCTQGELQGTTQKYTHAACFVISGDLNLVLTAQKVISLLVRARYADTVPNNFIAHNCLLVVTVELFCCWCSCRIVSIRYREQVFPTIKGQQMYRENNKIATSLKVKTIKILPISSAS